MSEVAMPVPHSYTPSCIEHLLAEFLLMSPRLSYVRKPWISVNLSIWKLTLNRTISVAVIMLCRVATSHTHKQIKTFSILFILDLVWLYCLSQEFNCLLNYHGLRKKGQMLAHIYIWFIRIMAFTRQASWDYKPGYTEVSFLPQSQEIFEKY